MTQKTDGQQAASEGQVLAPDTVLAGNFVVGEIVGQGGMAVVYRGIQKSLNRVVALKVLHSRFSRDPRFIERFEAEAGALASLSHPNIVNIIDRGSDGDHYFFVMEMVEGRTLDQLIIANTLSRSDWKRVIASCRDALDYVHKRGVVHRDIKPSNILIHEEGAVKIGDFGIAHIVHGDAEAKAAAELSRASPRAIGTANYMAPEQTTDPGSVDARADVFALGVTFYKMFARALPVGNFPDPSVANPEVPSAVDPVLLKAMAAERNERYASVSEFCDDLLKALKDQGTSITSVLGNRKAGAGASSLYSGDDFKAKPTGGPSDSRFKIPDRTPRPQKTPKPPKPPKGQAAQQGSYSTTDLLKNLTPAPRADSTSSGFGHTPRPATTPQPSAAPKTSPKPVDQKTGTPPPPSATGSHSAEKKSGGAIIAVIVVLLLAGGVGAGIMLFGGSDSPSRPTATPATNAAPQTRISEERERMLDELARERAEQLEREQDLLRGRIQAETNDEPPIQQWNGEVPMLPNDSAEPEAVATPSMPSQPTTMPVVPTPPAVPTPTMTPTLTPTPTPDPTLEDMAPMR